MIIKGDMVDHVSGDSCHPCERSRKLGRGLEKTRHMASWMIQISGPYKQLKIAV